MVKKCLIEVFFLTAALAGCNLQTETDLSSDKEIHERSVNSGIPSFPDFRAAWEHSDDTRTMLDEDGVHVLWEPQDELLVLYGSIGYNIRYKTDIQEPSSLAVFKPDYSTYHINYVRKNYDITGSPNPVYKAIGAFYPAPREINASTFFNGGDYSSSYLVDFLHCSVQEGKEDSFHARYMPAWSLASPDDPHGALNFYFICGGVRFNVAQEGIKAVVFRSRDGAPLAGRVVSRFGPDNRPEIYSVISGTDSVKVNAPGEAFVPGKHYYAVMLPQMLEQGISVTFLKNNQSASVDIDKSLTVRRARFGILDELDKGLVFKDTPPSSTPDGNIAFEDSTVKGALRIWYDANGDGEISYAEAASVSSFDALCSEHGYADGMLTIKSFDELRFFTGVKVIPPSMFSGCEWLTSIVLPPSIISVGMGAFENCKSLRDVRLPDGLESLQAVFYGCTSLKEITLPSSLKNIEAGMFNGCTALEEVHLPSSLQSIGGSAFYNCAALKRIQLPSTLKRIESAAFLHCTSLTEVEIPDGVTEIGTNAFQSCINLQTIIIGNVIEAGPSREVGFIKSRFDNYAKHIILSAHVTQIPELTFANCTALRSVQLPAGLKTIEKNAFAGCLSLFSLDIPESVTEIGRRAFYMCQKLGSAELPEHLSVLGSDAFSFCSQMRSIRLKSPAPPQNSLDSEAGDTGERFDHNPCWFYVPDAAVETYKADSYFAKYASRIRPLAEYTGD